MTETPTTTTTCIPTSSTSGKVDGEPTSSLSSSTPPYTVHTFPPTPHCYNISPFAVKLESFLRINKIDYDIVYTSKFSKRGTIPYITLNETGEQLCDSNRIIAQIQQSGTTTDATALTPEQRAISHAMIRMLEEHTTQIGFYYRYGLNMPAFFASLDLGKFFFNSDTSMKGRQISKLWQRFQPAATLKKTKARGLARHDLDVLWSMSFDDLDALEVLLGSARQDNGGSHSFFFGSNVPTTLDCAVFGHLIQFLYIPIDFPQKEHLHTKCPNLIAFIERFKEQFWPDWEKKCERQRNEKYSDDETNGKNSSVLSSRKFLLTTAAIALVTSVVVGYNRRT